MPIFPLILHKTYREQGFFNVTVAFDKYVRPEGALSLLLSAGGEEQRIAARVNRSANQNGTARILGGPKLRAWFLSHFDVGAELDVDLASLEEIRITRIGSVNSTTSPGARCLPPARMEPRPAVPTSSQVSSKRRRVEARLALLIEDFDQYVSEYDAQPPFQEGQYQLHRATIDRRRSHPTVLAALADDGLLSLLHQTLQSWRIGMRASRLAPLDQFKGALRAHAQVLSALDGALLEKLTDGVEEAGANVWRCIEEIPIVDNIARVVPVTKTLHHLLPDLVPPMDRAWTGRFFEWGPSDLRTRRSFLVAWQDFARVAVACRPSRLVGAGWRTSSTKVLDNAVVACAMR